jgi:TRAP transporter TAXI family solute receptor
MNKIIASTALLIGLTSSTAWSQVISIGTNPSGTSSYSVAAAIAKVVSENTKLKMRVAPQGGPVVTIPLLNEGEFEFSMGVSVVAFLAHKGAAMFKKIGPQKNMRILATILPSPIAYMTKRSAGLNTLDDLKGKKIGSGYPKQKIVAVFGNAYLKAGGIAKDQYTPVSEPNAMRGIQDFMAGRIDATIMTILSGGAQQADAKVGGLRWIPLPKSPAAQKVALKGAPGTIVVKLQPGFGVGIKEEIEVLSTPMVIMANVNVADNVAYQVAKIIHKNKTKLQASYKSLSHFNPKDIAVNFGVPYHSGAEKYYREAGVWQSK